MAEAADSAKTRNFSTVLVRLFRSSSICSEANPSKHVEHIDFAERRDFDGFGHDYAELLSAACMLRGPADRCKAEAITARMIGALFHAVSREKIQLAAIRGISSCKESGIACCVGRDSHLLTDIEDVFLLSSCAHVVIDRIIFYFHLSSPILYQFQKQQSWIYGRVLGLSAPIFRA